MSTVFSFQPFALRGFVKCFIIPVKPNGLIPKGRSDQDVLGLGRFLLNPDTWNDIKTANWVKHKVPGLSDPVQQWTSSGPRQVTFQALITRDLSEATTRIDRDPPAIACDSRGNANVIKRIAKIAALIAGIDTAVLQEELRPKSGEVNLNITDRLNFYRSLVYPNTFNTNGKVFPPNPVQLLVGSSLGARTKNALWVVDKVEIKITKQFSDLTPIEALVTFTLTELVDTILSSDTNILTDI